MSEVGSDGAGAERKSVPAEQKSVPAEQKSVPVERASVPVETERFLDGLGRGDELPATDDVIARVLPLFEQVLAVHARGRVAPLEGVEALRTLRGRLFFPADAALEPRAADAAVARRSRDRGAALRVEGHYRRDDEGTKSLLVGELADTVERPVYLPRFVAWEHVLGHHDPLSDVFSLGIVAASVALDVDLGDREELERFVLHRRRLTVLSPRLHPVVARVIEGMTELDRHDRSQDLASIVATLRSYREQQIEAELPEGGGPGPTRKTAICRALRDRLFDFSRRNRLLHFRPTSSTVDLTAASVPLVLDVKNVDASTLFTFAGRAAADVLAQKPFPLSRYLRLEDHPFVAPALDALRLEAKRSRAELGFSQLRLVVCFLHWHDLAEAPEQRITSPLLLVPCDLEKKRGVREAYTLEATDDWAEVNPVLRQYLRQRYGIDLPERVDLSDAGAIDALHARLTQQIQATEPGVTLEKVDRPRIDLVLAVARKRLDAYRKKVRLSGRGARSRGSIDYAYTGGSLRPLGVQLYQTYVAPVAAPDAEIHDAPRPRPLPIRAEETSRELYSLKNAANDGGPYRWAFDLTSVTLAHFNYRNVSLVRDYTTLIDEDATPTAAFEAIFRDDAKPVEEAPTPIPLDERHEVVLADPTQSAAIARARTGASYVIQGPPGTGKSQTITNLIADHVARGQRVLFVCEKRAALDVVHHRLVQVGMGPLACLIHDAQEDKKGFLQDLRTTYEGWLAAGVTTTAREARQLALARTSGVLARASRLERAVLGAPSGSDAPLLEVLSRAVELRDVVAVAPEGASLPSHRALVAACGALDRVESSLRALGHAGPIAGHPARLLGAGILDRASTPDALRASLRELEEDLASLDGCEPLVGEASALVPLRDVVDRHELARRARVIAQAGLAALLDSASEISARVRAIVAEIGERERRAAEARETASGWREPLPEGDASRALALARRFEGGFFARLIRWLSPAWWKLRSLLRARFDVSSRAVLGDWSEILEALVARHRADRELEATRARLAAEAGGDRADEILRAAAELRDAPLAPAARALRDRLARGTAGSAVDVARDTAELPAHLAELRGWDHLDVRALRRELESLSRDALSVTPLRGPLAELDRAGSEVSAFVRRWPIDARGLEALVVRDAIRTALRERAPDLAIAEGSLDGLGDALADGAGELRAATASALVEGVRARFVERAQLATAAAAGLATEQKDLKKQYAAGRRELEHELGKVMRHKTIRELVSGPAGIVVRDLKPIWLMSPLSVADVLPLASTFDVVIFDEASQIPLENAIPAIQRAPACVVVGDRQQLPPTNFFAASIEGEGADVDEAEGALDRELDADSLLTHADRTLPSTMLGWHYRSRHESLIDFSNRVFYGGRLLTVPPVAQPVGREPIAARSEGSGEAAADRLLERPISFHRVEDGIYEARRNLPEARYVAELVGAILARGTGLTIGVVAFSEAQQSAIESALAELGERDPAMRTRIEEEMAREEDGQHVGLFVKNLENVQGDERDVIVVSVCYGPDPRGRMIMNFGPINRRGGERRLNVIFSRAKHHVALVSTIGWDRITNDYNDGAACLKSYLRYAECSSVGDVAGARSALLATSAGSSGAVVEPPSSPVARAIAEAMRAKGWDVVEGVGASRLRCDLAIRRPGEARHRLGVLVDHADHWALGVDQALRLKPGVLRAFGWTVTTVMTKDWLADPDAVTKELESRASSTR